MTGVVRDLVEREVPAPHGAPGTPVLVPMSDVEVDELYGALNAHRPVPNSDDGTRTATALCVALVGLSVPFAAALTFAEQPVAAVGGGLFAAGGVLAALAMNGGKG